MTTMVQSKTVAGLVIILTVTVGLALAGKLTAEVVEILKWCGSTYFGVRAAANIAENMGKNRPS